MVSREVAFRVLSRTTGYAPPANNKDPPAAARPALGGWLSVMAVSGPHGVQLSATQEPFGRAALKNH